MRGFAALSLSVSPRRVHISLESKQALHSIARADFFPVIYVRGNVERIIPAALDGFSIVRVYFGIREHRRFLVDANPKPRSPRLRIVVAHLW